MLKLTTTLHTNYVHTSARKANSINLDHKTLYIAWLFSDARILDSYRLRNGYVCMYVCISDLVEPHVSSIRCGPFFIL